MKKKWVVFPVLLALVAAAGAYWIAAGSFQRTEGKFFDSNGVQIHYAEWGQGDPVILVHGFAANFDVNWRAPGIVDELATEYRVIALDDRGHGKSARPEDANAYGVEMVNDVIRLMDHLQLPKAHVIGYSMGGFITLKMIAMYPDRLLSAAPCAAGWAEDTPEERARVEGLAASLEAGKGYGPLFAILEPGGKEPSALKVAAANAALNKMNDPKIMAKVIRSLQDLAVTEADLRKNTVPVLSVVGSIDPLRNGIDRMVGVMQHHKAVFVEGGDHITTLENKDYVNALKEFLHAQRAQLSSKAA
ncbi:MAG: alpha/beta hydrolase [Candidatus Hydrogenedentes bacterium]|nr:alpha/beta hydrolase [Candidatus Hydrogenedentota bacterium]